ncbi:MAG: DUF2141 domain-containing protein [Candidatus Obscuribacterales bacterium]|nr:DUF2141 domain-containing protein [Candidatus Obscuribacterales bacterium]
MLKKRIWLSLVSAMIFSAGCFVHAADQGTLIIHVSGLKNSNGSVRVALFNSDASYTNDKFTGETAFRKEILPIKNNAAECAFTNLPYGDYAIKLFHNEDNSGKFETGIFGIPKVQYGFSNNAHGKFGPAGYDKAMFHLGSTEQSMNIEMQ